MNRADKYKAVKTEIMAIYHENKGRYGYRRITTELHKRNFLLNHKTVLRLMKELGLVCRVRMKKYRSFSLAFLVPYPRVINFEVSFATKFVNFCNYLFGNLFVWLSAVNIGDRTELSSAIAKI